METTVINWCGEDLLIKYCYDATYDIYIHSIRGLNGIELLDTLSHETILEIEEIITNFT